MGPDWEQAVGKFILALGGIEHTTISFFRVLPGCVLPKSAPKISLGLRIEMLKEALGRHQEVEYVEALRAIKAVDRLVSDRNLVAHNGVVFDFYTDGESIKITSHLTSSRNGEKRLSLEQMQTLALKAHVANLELSNAWIAIAKLGTEDADRG